MLKEIEHPPEVLDHAGRLVLRKNRALATWVRPMGLSEHSLHVSKSSPPSVGMQPRKIHDLSHGDRLTDIPGLTFWRNGGSPHVWRMSAKTLSTGKVALRSGLRGGGSFSKGFLGSGS